MRITSVFGGLLNRINNTLAKIMGSAKTGIQSETRFFANRVSFLVAQTDIRSTRTPKKPGFCEKPGFCWGQKRDRPNCSLYRLLQISFRLVVEYKQL
jgi:hypothetical protein